MFDILGLTPINPVLWELSQRTSSLKGGGVWLSVILCYGGWGGGGEGCSHVLHNTGLILQYQTFKSPAIHRFIKEKAGNNYNTILNIHLLRYY